MMILDLPRWFGNPWQYKIDSWPEAKQFIKNNNGKAPVFTSHNAHPNKSTVLHRYVPFDFDCAEKVENAMNDALSLLDWCREKELASKFHYSGSKGFHGFLVFNPQLVKNNNGLKNVYKRIQETAAEEAKLRTADPKLVGDTRRMIRVMNTRHQDSKLWCVEVPVKMLERADVEEVLNYAQTHHPPSRRVEPRETFFGAMERLDLPELSEVGPSGDDASTIPYKDDIPEFVKAVLPRPCIHNGVMEKNPAHMVRLEAATSLVNLGYDLPFLLDFFDQVAEEARWVDRHRKDVRNYQVDWCYRNPGYKPHSCQKLRSEGHCIGAECEHFAKHWPGEVEG